MSGERVIVCEVGPRDGLQMAASRMPTPVKTRWIAAMAAAGVPELVTLRAPVATVYSAWA